jgi:undecaprenyl-diphosphatase
MAFARVYVGAHHPGDVLTGLVLGAVVAVAVNRLTVRSVTAVVDRLARSPLGPFIARSGEESERA